VVITRKTVPFKIIAFLLTTNGVKILEIDVMAVAGVEALRPLSSPPGELCVYMYEQLSAALRLSSLIAPLAPRALLCMT
jgi:hypothetical protein